MERLTFDGNFCDIAQCRELPCQHGGNCSQKQVWERLKAYEDTGLGPEEVERSKLEIEAGCVKAIARTYGIDINCLRKLAEAYKDGRLVPCKELCGAVDGAAKKILTRGGRIRAMSDAELAGLFFQFRVDAYGRSQGAEVVLPDSMESIEKWLGEPVLGCEKEVFSLG